MCRPFLDAHRLTPRPSQEAYRADFQVVMGARSRLREVVDVNHREQSGVHGVEHEMGVVPAAIFNLEPKHERNNCHDPASERRLTAETHEHVDPTQQESSRTSGSSSPPASNTSPVQALNLTDCSGVASRSAANLQTGKFRQWMMTCCTASELSRCRKFIWTRPTLNVGCSNRRRQFVTCRLCIVQDVRVSGR